MATVLVTALYDEDLNFFPPNGELKEIDISSIYLGTRNLPTLQIAGANTNDIPTFDCLVMKDPTLGTLYLNMTLDEWNTAVTNVTSSGNATSIVGVPIAPFTPVAGHQYAFYCPDETGIEIDDLTLKNNSTLLGGFNPGQLIVSSSDGSTIFGSDGLTFDGSALTVKSQINLLDGGDNGVQLLAPMFASTVTQVFQEKDGAIALTSDISDAQMGSITGVGDLTIDRPAGSWLLSVSISPDNIETIQIGTTPGGSEIITATPFVAGQYTTLSTPSYFESATTIYVSGALGNVNYKFHY